MSSFRRKPREKNLTIEKFEKKCQKSQIIFEILHFFRYYYAFWEGVKLYIGGRGVKLSKIHKNKPKHAIILALCRNSRKVLKNELPETQKKLGVQCYKSPAVTKIKLYQKHHLARRRNENNQCQNTSLQPSCRCESLIEICYTSQAQAWKKNMRKQP